MRQQRQQGGIPIKILLVEDNPGDVLLIQEALEDARIVNALEVVEDGEKAIAHLKQKAPYDTVSRPDLILLDLNLPRLSGHEVLEVIKMDADLRRIPVVVLTTSDADHDVLKSYDLHANSYITKPVNVERFSEVIRQLNEFWFSIVKLPPRGQS